MALIYEEGFDNIFRGAGGGAVYEGWYESSGGHDLNQGASYGKWSGGAYRISSGNVVYNNGPNAPPIGTYVGFAPFVVTHPTEIRFATWIRFTSIPFDSISNNYNSGNSNGPFRWTFRFTDANRNVSLAIWIDANTISNGICISKYQANANSVQTDFKSNLSSRWSGNWGDNQYHHLEVRFVAANGTNASGVVQAWIDNQLVMNFNGVVTSNANTIDLTSITRLEYSGQQGDTYLDDLVIFDSTGNTMNGYPDGRLGYHRIRNYYPRANGTYSGQFNGVGNTGGNWRALTDSLTGNYNTQTDSDTSYVESTTANNRESYVMAWANNASPGNIGTVQAVVVRPIVRNPDVGTKTYSVFVRSGGAESNLGTILTANATYSVPKFIFHTDPSTNNAWTSATVNAFEAGIEIES